MKTYSRKNRTTIKRRRTTKKRRSTKTGGSSSNNSNNKIQFMRNAPRPAQQLITKWTTADGLKQLMLASKDNMNTILGNISLLMSLKNANQIYNLIFRKLLLMLKLSTESTPSDVFYSNNIPKGDYSYAKDMLGRINRDEHPLTQQNKEIINDILNSLSPVGRYNLFVYAANVSIMDEGILVIPNGTKVIHDFEPYNQSKSLAENYTFKKLIKKVIIPDSVTTIGFFAFGGCSSLKEVDIPNSVTSIGKSAFESCSNLKKVVIGNSVTTIGDYAFQGCSRLASVVIPNSVAAIGFSAFGFCENLVSVTFKELNNDPQAATSLTIGQEVWIRTQLEDIIPDGKTIHIARKTKVVFIT